LSPFAELRVFAAQGTKSFETLAPIPYQTPTLTASTIAANLLLILLSFPLKRAAGFLDLCSSPAIR